jgi:hypothetical protein
MDSDFTFAAAVVGSPLHRQDNRMDTTELNRGRLVDHIPLVVI